jgi:glycosyltransferase involved in cell wall biosynthesis
VIRAWLWATPSPRISRKLISQASFMLSAGLRGLPLPRPDVVFIEAQPIFTSLAGVLLARWKRVPYVLNVSDLWPDHLLSVGAMTATHPAYRAARWLVDRTYRGAAGIVAMSPAWAEAIAGYIGANDKIRVIYNGVDLERFRPGLDAAAFRQKYNLGDTRLVTFIGTLATQYDLDTMLNAAERLAARSDTQVVFIGGGSQNETLRAELARRDLSNLRWLDWIDHNEIPLAWAVSDVTFWALRDQPLYRGTIPAKLYEALACGLPVVAAAEGVGTQMITDSGAGYCVPFRDAAGLAEQINRLLGDAALRDQCARAARAYAERHFDPQRVAGAYEAVLSHCVREK